mmetsp:Transcript_107072/g.301313  ORF Transcript_107072/g.301313 Transcript_107072/m.301313 type:complete len:234 (-) Transcript_107072:1110-1811(-)
MGLMKSTSPISRPSRMPPPPKQSAEEALPPRCPSARACRRRAPAEERSRAERALANPQAPPLGTHPCPGAYCLEARRKDASARQRRPPTSARRRPSSLTCLSGPSRRHLRTSTTASTPGPPKRVFELWSPRPPPTNPRCPVAPATSRMAPGAEVPLRSRYLSPPGTRGTTPRLAPHHFRRQAAYSSRTPRASWPQQHHDGSVSGQHECQGRPRQAPCDSVAGRAPGARCASPC